MSLWDPTRSGARSLKPEDDVPTFHIYWADKRPRANQPVVADAVSRAMAETDAAMITGPADVTFWFHRFALADIYLNGVSLAGSTTHPIEERTDGSLDGVLVGNEQR